MAGSYRNINNDSMDINELASLNEDISDDFLNQLQDKLSNNSNTIVPEQPVNENDDSTLFEEPSKPKVEAEQAETQPPEAEKPAPTEQEATSKVEEKPADEPKPKGEEKKEDVKINQVFDDNFIKKYKAKLNKKAQAALQNGNSVSGSSTKKYMQEQEDESKKEPIEKVSDGNISEHPLTSEVKEYNESLDFLDGNVKYSKYVIYIDPKNVDFIDGLTVKERKNLINNILRQQDDISINKQRFALIQTIIRQVIIAILTVSISIPVVYYVINASLEATIDNHRRSQTNWQTLYRQHGKITQN